MKRRFALTITIISVFLIFNPTQVLPQDDFNTKTTRYAQERERAHAALTSDEKKLVGGLYEILRLAEQADSIPSRQQDLTSVLQRNRDYRVDSRALPTRRSTSSGSSGDSDHK